MKVMLLEVSHWHFPLYQEPLRKVDVDIVAVSDRDQVCRERAGAYFGCPSHADWQDALRVGPVDFAFAFGRHSDSPRIGKALIESAIPFVVEKPCGRNAADVMALRRAAEARNLFVAVPFVYRVSDLLRSLRGHKDGAMEGFRHIAVRNIAGPPQRYLENGSPWMLDPEASGGGCTINLAVHFIDLARVLTGHEVASVYARMSKETHGTGVEDYSLLTLTMADGSLATVETGYTFPMTEYEKREFTLTLSSPGYYARTVDKGIRVYPRAAQESSDLGVDLDTDNFYADFVERTLNDFCAERPPVASLADAEAVMRVVDAGYASSLSGEAVFL